MPSAKIKFPIPNICSNCGTPFMELKIIDYSPEGVFSFVVVVIKLEGCLGLFTELDRMLSLLLITFLLSEIEELL